jgi:hypothetical protein
MKRQAPHLRIIATCPETGRVVPTHAWMTARQISRFGGRLVFFCGACRQAHLLRGDELRLAQSCGAIEAEAVASRPLGRRTGPVVAATLRLVRHVARVVRPSAHPAGVAGERLERA